MQQLNSFSTNDRVTT